MDRTEAENWMKVKVALENAGKTDVYYYKLALKKLGLPGGENVKEMNWSALGVQCSETLPCDPAQQVQPGSDGQAVSQQ